MTADLTDRATSAQLDLRIVRVVDSGDGVRKEFESSDIPTKHVWWKASFDAAEEKGDSDTTETNSAIQWVPSRDLRASLENVAELERHNTNNWIMLAVA